MRSSQWIASLSIGSCLLLAGSLAMGPAWADEVFSLRLRSQPGAAGETFERSAQWSAEETAVIVCDVWDRHHCLNAVRRLEEFAPRLNQFLIEARRRGATIIHAPSDCLPAYAGHPARQRVLDTPAASSPPPRIDQWCLKIPAEEQAEYPIDQSDGGEDDDPAEHDAWAAELKRIGRDPGRPWQRQSDMIEIDGQRDYISDRGDEVWNILGHRDIQHVILTGVHANMCVLGRPFGLRQMVRGGKEVVLVRDLTDSMYNPQRWPFVDHFTGHERVLDHIERFVCPTITSDQLLGGLPFQFRQDSRHAAAKSPAVRTKPEPSTFQRQWSLMPVPGSWQAATAGAIQDHRGVAWYRCTLLIPSSWVDARQLTLALGDRAPAVQAWLNGKPLTTSAQSGLAIPSDAILADDANLLVLRVDHPGGAAAWSVAPEVLGGPEPWKLAGRWQFRLGDDPSWSNIPLPARFGTSTDVVFVPPSLSPLELPIRFEVSSGRIARQECPVSVALPRLAVSRPMHLVELGTEASQVPCQMETGLLPSIPNAAQRPASETPTVTWILQGTTPPGATRKFELRAGWGSQHTSRADEVRVRVDRQSVLVSSPAPTEPQPPAVIGASANLPERPLLGYQRAHTAPPAGIEPANGRSAYIHPLHTPRGRIVTDEFPPDHAHQSGLFLAYTKTEFGGRHPNFWDLVGGTGRVRYARLLATSSGPLSGGWVSQHEHVDLGAPEGEVALRETWHVRVWPGLMSDCTVVDITSTQVCAGDKPLRVLEYHYGGMALRGAREWTPESSLFRTSEGKGRENGNHTRPRWCDLSGKVAGEEAGLAMMTHPTNFRFPEPLRIHPTMPYMVYTPAQLGDWEITVGQPHVARYRFVAHDGPISNEQLDRLWQDFADPPQVTVVAP